MPLSRSRLKDAEEAGGTDDWRGGGRQHRGIAHVLPAVGTQARLSLHYLDEICEDQRAAVQDWIESLKTWPDATSTAAQRERDQLQVRSRDVLEHIERVVHHVRRLEQSTEATVQMHFNAQSHRTSEIMRTLTVLTAIFLPLNLIAGIFGMNFEFIPFLHQSNGFWFAMGAMLLIAVGLVLVFSRKRYLERSAR